MNKPEGYDNITISGNPVIAGGHKCVIKKVTVTTSKAGNQMLEIMFDMSKDDAQAGYYLDRYTSDKEAGKKDVKWRGVQRLVTDENSDYGTSNLKRFNTAVEESNDGFVTQWIEDDTKWANQFKDKLVGIIFRAEEFKTDRGNVATAVKPWRFTNYATAENADVPEKVKLKEGERNYDFMNAADDEGLPFN